MSGHESLSRLSTATDFPIRSVSTVMLPLINSASLLVASDRIDRADREFEDEVNAAAFFVETENRRCALSHDYSDRSNGRRRFVPLRATQLRGN